MRASDLEITARLSERDWAILQSLSDYRFLLTRQVARLHFAMPLDAATIPRTTNLALNRLQQLGLVGDLARRIGGVRAGSSGKVWQLSELAVRLLAHRDSHLTGSRSRPREPGSSFLEHTLAVAEVLIRLLEITAVGDIALDRLEQEPTAWRPYLDRTGTVSRLKPDAAATTTSAGYQDAWFLEVDRDTESPSRIVRKCLQYQDYRRSGTEQASLGVFPAVVWIVPSARRRDQLRRHLTSEPAIDDELFTVITIDQLSALVRDGATAFNAATNEAATS